MPVFRLLTGAKVTGSGLAAIPTVLVAILALAGPASGATPGELDPNFDPNASGGGVYSSAAQPDGKILIGGAFTTVGGELQRFVARLKIDGSLDQSFAPDVDGIVYSLELQPNGKILIAGNFNSVQGITRSGVARLNSDGSLDSSFIDPNVNNSINKLDLQSDGKVVIGGAFSSVNGVTRTRVARLNSDGSLDSSFIDPNVSSTVFTLKVQADGKILLGGVFGAVSGVVRNYLARLNANGSLDSGFNPNPNDSVTAFDEQPDGKILIGGKFTTIGGVTRNRVARLSTNGNPDSGFSPSLNNAVRSFELQADGKILIGGEFTAVGLPTRNHIARLGTDGILDPVFNPNTGVGVGVGVYSIETQPDGRIVLTGTFDSVGGVPRSRVARVLGAAPTAAPTAVTARVGDERTRVSWTPVPGEVPGYTATANPGGQSCTTSSTSCTITGLTNSNLYTVTVTASNDFGSGPASDPPALVVPNPTVSISSVKTKVTRKTVLLTSRVKVSRAGKVVQRATTGKGKKKTWCRASKSADKAGSYTLKCNLGKKGRSALRKKALKLTLRTTFTPTLGSAAKAERKLRIKRKR